VREPPVYRPFALIALAATLVVGTPLGIWMLARLHWGGGPVSAESVWLHAHLQVFGFFGTLIMGVAHHLVPRFAGRPVAVTRWTRWLAGALGIALGLRLAGAALGAVAPAVAAALLQALAFGVFGVWVARALDAPHLRLTQVHLATATAWLVAALVVETGLRTWTIVRADPGGVPAAGGMGAAHVMAIYGGVLGWILGVIVRAAPMLVPRWRVPDAMAWGLPGALGLGVALAAVGLAGPWPGTTRVVIERAGEAFALATVAGTALLGGAFRGARGTLPMAARSGPETWLFRMAMLAACVAAVGSIGAAAMVWTGIPLSLVADALRHLVTVGTLTPMVVGMGFRLIPVIEGASLPWPRLRAVAFWMILGGVLVRTAEVLADHGLEAVLPLVPLSGVLVWIALACLGATVIGAICHRRAV
jgi:hypothetical protein